DELLADKNTVSDYILKYATDKASMMGVALFECGIKDIILPGDMKEIMNQVLVAEKKAQANVIMRREETASTRSLLNTAKLMEDNEMLFRLKEMEYVEKIAENIKNITVSGGGQIFDQLKTMFGVGKAN
ncbi:MAG TPA: slipin family protein, partial [Saprospiraceae bacterium]|nr:slipin family protein [Saprospiraceae bacterium]